MRRPAALLSLVCPLLLGGLLPLTSEDQARWPTAGAWRMPVGDAYVRPAPDAARPAFRLLRNLQSGRDVHEGADLGNGREGDTVRAAACGLVVRSARDDRSGYGQVVVLAHRLPDDEVVYSVYAHLLPGSVGARAGDVLAAGEPLGRVGSSGRVSAPHLHFEVRTAGDPSRRWEHERPVDPLAFVDEHLGEARLDSSDARPYLVWAEQTGLLPTGARGPDAVTRAEWWRMLAGAARTPVPDVPERSLDLRDSLIAWSLLPEEAADDAPHATPGWNELARDLGRLRESPLRLAAMPVPTAPHREWCERTFGEKRPSRELHALSRRDAPATVAEACVLMADLAPEWRAATATPSHGKSAAGHGHKRKPKKRSSRSG